MLKQSQLQKAKTKIAFFSIRCVGGLCFADSLCFLLQLCKNKNAKN